MVQAPPEITVSSKELGKHLRSIRRKKGLSLSEVARGAGLSRRELVAYERGKVPIPESDLWVLAGSCGVDVSELVPSTSARELAAAADATSVGDTVSQLRRSQEDAGITPYLHTLQKLQALPPGKRIPVKDRELEEIATALGSTPRSIDQRLQEVLEISPDEAERLRAMILVPPAGRKKQRALPAAAPVAAPAPPPPAAAPVAPVVPLMPSEPVPTLPMAPAAFLDTPIDPLPGGNVDVFEELARLPEPVPLGDPSAPLPDMLAPHDPFTASPLVPVPAPPEGAVELVDNSMPPSTSGSAADTTPPIWNAADAPPIDVAMRQGSAIWDLGEPPLVPPTTTPDAEGWANGGWQPPAPEGTDGHTGFWEGTDAWAPEPSAAAHTAFDDAVPTTSDADDSLVEPITLGESTWAGSAWDPEPWTPEASIGADTGVADVNPWTTDEWPKEPADLGAWDHRPDPAAVDTGFYVDWGTDDGEPPPASTWDVFAAAPTPVEDTTEAVVEHEFAANADVVDHDTVDTDAPWAPAPDVDPPAERGDTTFLFGDATDDDEPGDDTDSQLEPEYLTDDPTPGEPAYTGVFVVGADAETVVELMPISWRADGDDGTDHLAPEPTSFEWITEFETATEAGPEPEPEPEFAPVVELEAQFEPEFEAEAVTSPWVEPADAPEPEPEPELVDEAAPVIEPEPEPEPEPVEFVTAGPDWQLGNALPLVEVRGQGALVMRRADERWALADVTTPTDCVIEAEVDFRSGPGLGVLFRASVDDEGRMSGYSFDIDPIYDGGGYLVRQWQADRELWNPIARVSGDDPSAMYGTLLVRLVVEGEHLSASVNGVEVLSVENLKQASADRGRDAANGDRVGVQAWSSSDLVIDAVRVAAR